MGQKVHPIGFRVGITKKHQSNWFAPFHNRYYAQAVLEDRLLRQTILNLFPTLFKKERTQKTPDSSAVSTESGIPTITQIQIERGMLPYEIGIRIHADNCARLRSSLDRLSIPREMVHQLQIARQSLLDYKTQCPSLGALGNRSQISPAKKEKSEGRGKGVTKGKRPSGTRLQKRNRSMPGKFKPLQQTKRRGWLSETKFSVLRSMRRRVRKRHALRYWQSRQNRWRRSVALLKQGNSFRLRTRMQSWKMAQKLRRLSDGNKSVVTQGTKRNRRPWMKLLRQSLPMRFVNRDAKGSSTSTNLLRPITWSTLQRAAGSDRQKAVVRAVVRKLNMSFLVYLRQQVQIAKKMLQTSTTSLAYRQGWSLKSTRKLKTYGWTKLNRLLRSLRRRGSKQLQDLRQRYLTDGRLSMGLVMPFVQCIRWAKVLKALLQTLPKPAGQMGTKESRKKEVSRRKRKLAPFCPPDGSKSWSVFHLRQQIQNIPEETRKLKLIGYLTNCIQKHRQENIYYYLATLAQAKRDLQQIQSLTKKYAGSLFDLNTPAELADAKLVTERVTQTVQNSLKQPEWEQGWKDTLMHHLHQQRLIAQQTLQLLPRISIKFYRVDASKVVCKASVIAASIVDQIEQRKAFRKVIKTAKENAMQQANVRGIKIQVAGRLNGAEIARTEWVRSGRVPLQTLRANIDYCYQPASTIYGIIGVKVWVFKGYSKVRRSYVSFTK
jgi:ribosomal protein S3